VSETPYKHYEEECSRCGGSGKVDEDWYTRHVECLVCRGRGLQLSDEGYDLLEFLKHYLRPKATPNNFGWED
jgi:hypothetical protein